MATFLLPRDRTHFDASLQEMQEVQKMGPGTGDPPTPRIGGESPSDDRTQATCPHGGCAGQLGRPVVRHPAAAFAAPM